MGPNLEREDSYIPEAQAYSRIEATEKCELTHQKAKTSKRARSWSKLFFQTSGEVCRKGETMTDLFETQTYARRAGTRVSDYNTVFDHRGLPPPKAVNVTEYEDDEGLGEDEADDDGIEELVQRELEALATDLGDTGEEELDHDQAEAVEKAAVQLSELPEALAAVRGLDAAEADLLLAGNQDVEVSFSRSRIPSTGAQRTLSAVCAMAGVIGLVIQSVHEHEKFKRWGDCCGHLKSLGLDKLATVESLRETFKFGDGGAKDSDARVRRPVAVPRFIEARLLDIPALNLLLGRDHPEPVRAEIKTSPPRRITIGPHKAAIAISVLIRLPSCARVASARASCERQGLCSGCKYDVDMVGFAEGDNANLVQNASWRFMERGHQKHNFAGVTQAKTLRDHGVSTNEVKKLIQLEQTDQAHGQAVAAIRRGRPRSYSLFELACKPISLLGREVNATGRHDRAFRVHLPECDLREKKTVEGMLMKIMKEKKLDRIPVVLISVPCTLVYLPAALEFQVAGSTSSFEDGPTGFLDYELCLMVVSAALTSEGEPIRKRSKDLTNRRPIAEKLCKKCDGTRVHARVYGGKDPNQTGRCPVSLVKDIASGLRAVRRGYDVLPVAHDGEITARAKAVLDAMGPAERVQLERVVKLARANAGHPTNPSLARAIRLRSGSAEAIAAVEAHRCPDCERRGPPEISASADLRSHFRDFADGVATDLMALADVEGHRALLQNNVDMATIFQLVAPHDDKTPIALRDGGAGLGRPRRALQTSEVISRWSSAASSRAWAPTSSPPPPWAPRVDSVCERRGGEWKYIAEAIVDECQIDFAVPGAVEWLCTVVNWAKNSKVGPSGYSPAQWVLRRGHRLPYGMLSTRARLSLRRPARGDRAFQRRVGMLAAAQRAAQAVEYDRRLSAAFLAKSRRRAARPSSLNFGIGDLGSAEEETPGPPLDFDASGLDKSADPEAKRPRFASVPEFEISVEMPPAQPQRQYPDPVSVEPETPFEQPMFDQEQFQRARSSQVPGAFGPDLYEQVAERPRVDEPLIMGLSLKESVDFDCSTLYPTRFRRVGLAGKSRGKGLVKMRRAIASKWYKWLAFNAVRYCSRWVLTEKDVDAFKARLVVQGCQDNDLGIRADAPTRGRDAFWLAAGSAAQHDWGGDFFDAKSACLQAEGIDRALMIEMPLENPPPGTVPGQIFLATGSVYGAKGAGRAWCLHLKAVLSGCQIHGSKLGRGRRRRLPWHECADDAGFINVTPEKAKAIEYIPIRANRAKIPESEVTLEEVSSFRSRTASTLGVRLVRGRVRILTAQPVFYGDSAFASAEGERSQCELVGGLTRKPGEVLTELKMAAKLGGPPRLKDVERQADDIKMTTFTDSKNLEETVEKDAGVVQDKRLRIVVSFLRETFAPAAAILRWIPTRGIVAGALAKVMRAGLLMAFMSGRDVGFSVPAPKSKNFVQVWTLAAKEADQQMEMTIKLAMQLKTQQVDQQMEIRTEPKHKKDMGYGRVQASGRWSVLFEGGGGAKVKPDNLRRFAPPKEAGEEQGGRHRRSVLGRGQAQGAIASRRRVHGRRAAALENGVDLPMCLGVCGVVVDVSSSQNFRPGHGYGKLWGGRDCTWAMAKTSLKAEDVGRFDWKLEDLNEGSFSALAGWYKHYLGRLGQSGA
ncbi:unnamed protein product [Prorocentrum cordatum]|uniref:Uncharacterized protein n=1 Tax=Prorocentrum cordatum TaxID=2364126 RepID=A0ABN9U617_9DINO|nr:unnamed protein product [Polarella glacialis]